MRLHVVQNSRPKHSTQRSVVTVAGINPAFTIWIRSSLLRFLSAALITIGALPDFLIEAFTFCKFS